MMVELGAEARAWLSADPDHDTQAELRALIDAAEEGDTAALVERFVGRLQFGTAGMRGELGAGPMRMNRVTVRRATAGLVAYLLAAVPDAAERGIVIGYDARRKSDAFARDTAGVAAALGLRARLLPRPTPTPVLAWAVPHLGAAAGVMVTASHNPPRDNGYKVYLEDGSQIVSPIDVEIAAAIDAVEIDSLVVAGPDHPLIDHLDDEPIEAYLDAAPARASGPGAARRHRRLHPHARRRRCDPRAGGVRASRLGSAGTWWPNSSHRIRDFPTVSFPNPEEPGAMDLLLALAAACGPTWPWPTTPMPTALARPYRRSAAAGAGSPATSWAGSWPITSCPTPPGRTAWS